MRNRIGGTIFVLGLAFIAGWVAYERIIRPIICGVTANCGPTLW